MSAFLTFVPAYMLTCLFPSRQRATTTAQTISSTISSSYETASQRLHTLTTSMLTELHSLQASASALPTTLGLSNLQEKLKPVIGEVKEVLKSEAPMKEKVGKLRMVVEESVKPVLESASARAQEAVSAVRAMALNGPRHEFPAAVENGETH